MKKTCLAATLFMTLLLASLTICKAGEASPEAQEKPQLSKFFNQPINPHWNLQPKTAAEWRALDRAIAKNRADLIQTIKLKLDLTVLPGQINGVPVYEITPARIAPQNGRRILLNLHSGGYTIEAGEAGLPEALLMAGIAQIKVVEADYRLAPEHPFPAALDDALAVYTGLLKNYAPEQIGVFGSSAGGGLALALVMRARDEGIPLPGAILVGAPWADLTKTGDTYHTNEGVDQVMVSYDGLLQAMANAYAQGKNLKDPWISPVYGDVKDFPPVLLMVGTRDLFVSNAARVHQKLRQANRQADLVLLEGLSHIEYIDDPDQPPVKFYFEEAAKFFDKYLK